MLEKKHLQPVGVTSWWCGLLSKVFENLFYWVIW